MYAVSDDQSRDSTSVKGDRTQRPLGFGKIVLRLIITTVFLSTIAAASLVALYFVAHKGGPAHDAVDYVINQYMGKKELPKQLKLFSLLMVGVAFLHTFLSHLVTLVSKQISLRKGINFGNPRSQASELTGLTARASAAHMNSHEAFPGFAAAVLCALTASVAPMTVATLAMTFIIFRTLYYPVYWFNIPPLRTFFWLVGWFSTVALFVTILIPDAFDASPQQWIAHLKELMPPQLSHLAKEL